MAIITSVQYHHLSLCHASISQMRSHTNTNTHPMHSAWMPQCWYWPPHVYLNTSLNVFSTFVCTTLKSSNKIRMLCLPCAYRHSSTALLGYNYPAPSGGQTLITTTPRQPPALNLCRILGLFPTKVWRTPSWTPIFCTALHQSHIMMEDSLLIYRKPIAGSESYARLIVVPKQLRNIVFIAFHSNPVGGHLNTARIFHCIRVCCYWPNMYTYITNMCHSSPGCALSNPARRNSHDLINNFPIEALMMVLHINGYQAGKESGFEGSSHYLITCCGMCKFAVIEPISNANDTTYASAIMRIILCFGICHTVVLDKDSKFFCICHETLDLLQINCHILSRSNHNPMLVKQ